MTNSEYITKLENFINSARPEWLSKSYKDYSITEANTNAETKAKAGALRQQARALILSISQDGGEDAWDRLSRGTKFLPSPVDTNPTALLEHVLSLCLARMSNCIGWDAPTTEPETQWANGESVVSDSSKQLHACQYYVAERMALGSGADRRSVVPPDIFRQGPEATAAETRRTGEYFYDHK